MARTQADIVSTQLGAQMLELARLQALVEQQADEIKALKDKMPIEQSALHEAGKSRKSA